MTRSAVQYECWGGPLDGCVVSIEVEVEFTATTLYMTYPLSRVDAVHFQPPHGRWTSYKVGKPNPRKAQWAGDGKTAVPS